MKSLGWWGGMLLALWAATANAGEVSLLFVGDVMLDQGPGRVVEKGGDPFAPFAPAFDKADMRIGNLELPITTSGTKSDKVYTFRAHPRVVPLLARYFDLLTVANNHSGDYGRVSFLETLDHLKQGGIAYVGGGRNAREAHRPVIVEKKGVKIAFLAYNEFKPRAFEATAEYAGIAWSEDDLVISDLRAVRPLADVVIPIMHWGWEREPMASQRQRRLARKMIDAGADVVVGGHPHVTQDIEYYKDHLIVYSLGNFVFDGFQSPQAKQGWLLHLVIDGKGMVSWQTVAAHMDEDGVPHPVKGAVTPCGGKKSRLEECQNIQQQLK